MGFAAAVTTGLKKYAKFSGRASRSEFWYFMLFYFIVLIAAAIVEVEVFPELSDDDIGPILRGSQLALLLPAYAVCARRLHDVDRSGWWLLLNFTGIGNIVLLVWFCMRGTDGANRFGEPPLRESDALGHTPAARRRRRWIRAAAVAAGVLMGGVVLLGALLQMGVLPSTSIVNGGALRERDRAFLIERGVIEPGETIELFYSAAMWSIKMDGNILTDQRVISYWEDNGEFYLYAAYYEEIESVEIEEHGGEWSDTVVLVRTLAGEEFRLFLSAEGERDAEFLSRLTAKMPAPAVPEGYSSYRT